MNDLISRQAAIDTLSFDKEMLSRALDDMDVVDTEREKYSWGLGLIESNIYDIEELPSAQQWIPCSERLPDEEGWYLVTIQNDKTRKRRTENDLFAIGIAEAHKHTPYKFCKDGHRQTVIAWMPIPEPYKAESEEV